MPDFEPELGQAIFGHGGQSKSASLHLEVAMDSLANAFDVCNPKADNPFANSAARYAWSCFEVHAYDWGDEGQPWNFKHRDLTVSWYKYQGRGMSCNRDISDAKVSEIFAECMRAMISETPVDQYDT